MVTDVFMADGFDAPERVALGLPAPQLAIAVAGAALAYLTAESGLAAAIRWPAVALLLLTGASLAWGRYERRPLLVWAVLLVRFTVTPRRGSFVVAAGDGGGEPAAAPSTTPRRTDSAGRGDDVPASPPMEPGAPEWARWLRADRKHPAAGPAAEQATIEVTEASGGDAAPSEGLAYPDPSADDSRVLQMEEAAAASPTAISCAPATDHQGGLLETTRTPLVLLPSAPVDDDLAEAIDPPDGDLELGEHASAVLPLGDSHRWPDEEVTTPPTLVPPRGTDTPGDVAIGEPPERDALAPVFVGATRRLTFFSLNGGSGRTTLATEVACLLAANGRHRAGPREAPRRLRVALLDLDLRSATVSLHLGIPQPTVGDYLLHGKSDPGPVSEYMVSHSSGLRALLGPPKPLAVAGSALEPARIAEIVHQLERDGTHFIIIDVSGDLNAVTTWVLGAVHDIYVVLTPTASGVQDAYRTTEALRRMGLAGKLQYVVNRARGKVDFDETMGDLGGRIVATIPYDTCIEEAENEHRIAALDRSGPAVDGIRALAAHIYPSLGAAHRGRRIGQFLKWRRAG